MSGAEDFFRPPEKLAGLFQSYEKERGLSGFEFRADIFRKDYYLPAHRIGKL